MTFSLWLAEIFQYLDYLGGGEVLGAAAVMEGRKTLAEGRTTVDPAHQMVGGGLRVALGEIEQGELLLAVTSDIHFF